MFSFLHAEQQKNAIAALDGVRAFACFSVVAFHLNRFTSLANIWSTSAAGPIAGAVALTGWAGVTLFFVLSGFLLFLPFARTLLFDGSWPSARRFYLRRAFRILPGYYISLVLLILLTHREYLQLDHLLQLGLFLTLFMDSTHATYQAINGPFWTLAVEWQFYLLLPLLALGFRWIVQRGSLDRRIRVLGLCLLAMIIWGVTTRYWGLYFALHPSQSVLAPRSVLNVTMFFWYGVTGKYLEDFAIGMLLSSLYVIARNAEVEQRIISWIRRYSIWLWRAGVLWLFFMAAWSAFPALQFLTPFFGANEFLTEIGFALGFGLCIAGLLFGEKALRSPLEWSPIRWLGFISYGVYMWHQPIILWFQTYIVPLAQRWQDPIIYSLYWLCVALVIIPFCYLFYRWVEQPWIGMGARLTSGRKES